MFDTDQSTSSRPAPGLLRIDSSAAAQSTSRQLADEVEAQLIDLGARKLTYHDLSTGIPHIDQSWLAANMTEPGSRTESHCRQLALSDQYIQELRQADILLVSAPVYNFSLPSTLKVWLDHIARARETFRYTEQGPEGLLKNKKAIVVMSSGGTELGSDIDFAWRYLRHMLAFVGIQDVTLIDAGQIMVKGDNAIEQARLQIGQLNQTGAGAPA